jgi:predicted metal-dependent hydrolase
MFDLLFPRRRKAAPQKRVVSDGGHLVLSDRQVPLLLVRNPRARRYSLRVNPDASVRLVIPRGGSEQEARGFADRHRTWVEGALRRIASRPAPVRDWRLGAEILLRGAAFPLQRDEADAMGIVRLGDERIRVADTAADLRPAVERHLWRLAARELPVRVLELAALHGITVVRVTVRNQRSRWGSCSRRGTISLNWRILQAPSSVQDYLILHELMHRRQMNHSPRFWAEVEGVCPDYRTGERWLSAHASLLR